LEWGLEALGWYGSVSDKPLGNKDVNYDDLDGVLLTMDLQTLGELAVDIVNAWCTYKGEELPTLRDENDKLTEDAGTIAGSAWNSILRMNDRREFAQSIMADLELLS